MPTEAAPTDAGKQALAESPIDPAKAVSSAAIDSMMTSTTTNPMICQPDGGGILLPLFSWENDTAYGPRAVIYGMALIWLFAGVAIVADIFMTAIEQITSTEMKVSKEFKGTRRVFFVRIWNPTVANLTLMALGSSAPEILLSVIELFGNGMMAGDLGPSTIVGSAAFNLLVIIGICVIAIPDGQSRKISEVGVYVCTGVASVLVYIWLVVILQVFSPEIIEPWEGIVTFVGFPLLVYLAYLLDIRFFDKLGFMAKQTESRAKAKKTTTGDGVDRDVVAHLLKDILKESRKRGDEMPADRLAEAVSGKLARIQAKPSRAYYRVQATREMVAGKKVGKGGVPPLSMSTLNTQYIRLDEEGGYGQKAARDGPRVSKEGNFKVTTIEFACKAVAVLEGEGKMQITVERTGNVSGSAMVRYRTEDGSAKAGEHIVATEGVLKFAPLQRQTQISVTILAGKRRDADEAFDIVLFDAAPGDGSQPPAELGPQSRCAVRINDDDDPGILSFVDPEVEVKESAGVAVLQVQRTGGSKGRVSCSFRTQNGSAIAGADYIQRSGELVFDEGETHKRIIIPIVDDTSFEREETFRVYLENPAGGVQFGVGYTPSPLKRAICEVSITSDASTSSIVEQVSMMARMPINHDALDFAASSWAEQFRVALRVNGGQELDSPPPKYPDYVAHALTLPFKLFFAFIPPAPIANGALSFVISLVFIGLVTAVIGDVAAIFGCCIGLPDSITAITFVALGTSLPDTFASKTAAVADDTADAAIVNVTGSNSVNVLLGLGLPWMIGALYWSRQGATPEWVVAYPDMAVLYPGGGFVVRSGDLVFSVSVFVGCAVACLGSLTFRRINEGYELGGGIMSKWAFGLTFVMLWLVYIAFSCLKTLDVI